MSYVIKNKIGGKNQLNKKNGLKLTLVTVPKNGDTNDSNEENRNRFGNNEKLKLKHKKKIRNVPWKRVLVDTSTQTDPVEDLPCIDASDGSILNRNNNNSGRWRTLKLKQCATGIPKISKKLVREEPETDNHVIDISKSESDNSELDSSSAKFRLTSSFEDPVEDLPCDDAIDDSILNRNNDNLGRWRTLKLKRCATGIPKIRKRLVREEPETDNHVIDISKSESDNSEMDSSSAKFRLTSSVEIVNSDEPVSPDSTSMLIIESPENIEENHSSDQDSSDSETGWRGYLLKGGVIAMNRKPKVARYGKWKIDNCSVEEEQRTKRENSRTDASSELTNQNSANGTNTKRRRKNATKNSAQLIQMEMPKKKKKKKKTKIAKKKKFKCQICDQKFCFETVLINHLNFHLKV